MNVNPEVLEIRLDDLGRRVNFLFPYINSGGCCVFAAIVTAELQRLGIPARGIVASYNPENHIDKVRPKINSNSLDEWRENGINFTHVGVEYEIDGTIKHYDSNGVREEGKRLMSWYIYKGRLLLEELKELSRTGRGWNNQFKRKDVPALKRVIKEELRSLV